MMALLSRRGLIWTALAGAFGLIAPVAKAAPPPMIFKRIFRCNDLGDWAEIQFEEIRPGDRVLALDLHEGILHSLEAWEAKSSPKPVTNQPHNMFVDVGYEAEMLPRKWGSGATRDAKMWPTCRANLEK